MTNLKSIFKKPVDRSIEGVIKADDEASLRLEVEEYVLTNEVEKRLGSFLNAYNHYDGANGVWVSGFFGSGKSHLLKILALLLENRQLEGVSTLDLFLPKCGDDRVLIADLERAVAIPSKSILFNIDVKADVISKKQTDALLSVFVKVFNEMCGYYGKLGYVAKFERDLDSRNLFKSFKEAYENLAKRTWESGREQVTLERVNIDKAYAKVAGDEGVLVTDIIKQYSEHYAVSIEDFANQVQVYLDQQPSNFRLNFFVDEVGQYIAENVKLMTNLQSIAESLATKSKGRAWVIVTAQEDMDCIVKEMTNRQSNDFSKIQDRFSIRMKLTSTDVAEVIEKRLLMKNNDGVKLLSDIYQIQTNNFKTLFDFADGSKNYRNFKDQDHFIHSYPFIPYQFALFQVAIQHLSQHNAFEGKHSSVGERSMLGVFQQVAIHINDHKIGKLATFDLMFEGIRAALKSYIQGSILQAEKHLESSFAIRLLKTLFLVKYVKEFKTTIRNLCVLMIDGFNQDLVLLRKNVEEGLNLLEQQTYIQRNGQYYEYLTNEEKDVEQAIKNTDVETSDIASELEKIIFEHIIKDRKIRYDGNEQDYSYSKKLDERLHGKEHELAINVISPFHENSDKELILRTQSMGRDELLVLMPADERLIQDILMYKRTEKYIRQNISNTQQEAVKRILTDKGGQNNDRYMELQQHVQKLLSKAKLMVAGDDVEASTEDAKKRIVCGFQTLISRVYTNLRMLRGTVYSENNIASYLMQPKEEFGKDIVPMDESEQEILTFIERNKQKGVRTTLKNLLEKFERKPYGWYQAATLCNLAKLCARGKVDLQVDSNTLENKELESTLRNTRRFENVILEPQVEYAASQIRELKTFYTDFFGTPPSTSEVKALCKEVNSSFHGLIENLKSLALQFSHYPFFNALKGVSNKLEEFSCKQDYWYMTELIKHKDCLLEIKENVIEPIDKFRNGSQKGIFDNAFKFKNMQQPNFDYLEGDDSSQLIEILNNPECFKGSHMQHLKMLMQTLQEKLTVQINEEIAKGKNVIGSLKERLKGMAEFALLNSEQQGQIAKSFSEFMETVDSQNLIAMIRDTTRCFEDSTYPCLLSQMSTWAKSKPKIPLLKHEEKDPYMGIMMENATAKCEPKIEFISSRSLKIPFSKAWIADEEDIDQYLKSMRKVLLEEIGKGKRVQV